MTLERRLRTLERALGGGDGYCGHCQGRRLRMGVVGLTEGKDTPPEVCPACGRSGVVLEVVYEDSERGGAG